MLVLLAFASPRKNITGFWYFRINSSRVIFRFASASRNSHSFPLVGRYRAMWMAGGAFGSDTTMGRKEEHSGLCMVTYGSRAVFHMTMVPPLALGLLSGRSMSYKSSELSEEEYSPLKYVMEESKSHWYNWGSAKKIRAVLGYEFL